MTAYCTIIDPNRETVCPTRKRETFLFQRVGAAAVSLM
jgi:hypothetical protein